MRAIIILGVLLPGLAFAADHEAAVRQVVQAFYTAFEMGSSSPSTSPPTIGTTSIRLVASTAV